MEGEEEGKGGEARVGQKKKKKGVRRGGAGYFGAHNARGEGGRHRAGGVGGELELELWGRRVRRRFAGDADDEQSGGACCAVSTPTMLVDQAPPNYCQIHQKCVFIFRLSGCRY